MFWSLLSSNLLRLVHAWSKVADGTYLSKRELTYRPNKEQKQKHTENKWPIQKWMNISEQKVFKRNIDGWYII